YAGASHLHAGDPARFARRLTALCRDSVRAVRMAAAARLAELPSALLDATQSATCQRGLDEYIASQRFTSDMPSGPFNLGNLFAKLERDADAEREYRRAIAIDDKLVQARVNLALLLARDRRQT